MLDFNRDTDPMTAPKELNDGGPADVAAIVQIAIETTGRSASLAILRGDTVLASYFLDDRTRTAASLAPAVKRALTECALLGEKLSLVSVADGPGSFTGLRIGITTAKTLAYALRLPIVGVDSVASVAVAAFCAVPGGDSVHSLRVALDAYRGQAFVGEFCRDELIPEIPKLSQQWSQHPSSVRVVDGKELEDFFGNALEGTYFAGDQKALGGRVAEERRVEFLGLSGREPTVVDAVGVGRLAIRAYALGRTMSPMELLPRYLRPSAAEEKASLQV